WLFTPDVIIEPAMEKWIFAENPGYDVWTSQMLAEVMDEDYVRLTGQEIEAVLDSCRFPA
ncbi:MAG: hypothetical protein JRJ54_13465, partial [Deltaproteobacteria bacterium]|nr:hypothetical protein [Deltaproteobacteria bacterium]